MKTVHIALLGLATIGLGACASYSDDDDVYVAPAPVGPGAVVGTVAADVDGDGMIDGYYDANGNYTAWVAPPCPPAPAPVYVPEPTGERG
ncbi:hypothetical protein [Aurantiacibacter aquimixticola]|uniref:Uncharacterized protein n=1 Tax=Aurantiacibacter aquimixticola TaxID=1958945 RepID=A0A419RU60_9SPHN|nr:hypothetical protein [Aurantiacibacter aquimixticola]RJY09325.1 hypothetical protein D6201_08125 [Aurantiacibacter aquimixticola]